MKLKYFSVLDSWCLCVLVWDRLVKGLCLLVTVHWAADQKWQIIGCWQVSVWLTAWFYSRGSFPLYNFSTVSFLLCWGPVTFTTHSTPLTFILNQRSHFKWTHTPTTHYDSYMSDTQLLPLPIILNFFYVHFVLFFKCSNPLFVEMSCSEETLQVQMFSSQVVMFAWLWI